MLRSLLILLLVATAGLLVAQKDTTYTIKYAFVPADPTKDLEAGQEDLLVDGMYRVWDGQRYYWGFYDETTKEKLTKPKYDTITYRYLNAEKRGFYRIKENGQWGLLAEPRNLGARTI